MHDAAICINAKKELMQQVKSEQSKLRTRMKRLVRRTICFSRRSACMHGLMIELFIDRDEFGLPII